MSDIKFDYDSATDELHICSLSTQQTLLQLEGCDVWELIRYWVDGFCICGKLIPQNHIVCKNCLDQAMDAWGIRRVE